MKLKNIILGGILGQLQTECGATLVGIGTRKQRHMCWAYQHSNIYSLYDAYQKPSGYKTEAYEDCLYEFNSYGIHGVRITGYSCHSFSIAGRIKDEEGKYWIYYRTKNNKYLIPYIAE